MRRFVLIAALPVLLVACLARTSGVQLLHTQLPAKPSGCPVNRIADDKSPYPVEDLANITLTYTPGGKDTAMKGLENQACYYGGDTVYRISEKETGHGTTEINATIARRPGGDAAPASS